MKARTPNRLGKWVPDGLREGDGRNDKLLRGIRALMALGHDASVIRESAREKNARLTDPLDDRELEQVICNAFRYKSISVAKLADALRYFNERRMFPVGTVRNGHLVDIELPSGDFNTRPGSDIYTWHWADCRSRGMYSSLAIGQETRLLY